MQMDYFYVRTSQRQIIKIDRRNIETSPPGIVKIVKDRKTSCSSLICKEMSNESDLTDRLDVEPATCSTFREGSLQGTELNEHQSGKRPFACTLCSKSFYHKDNLQRHMAVHSNEKLFECTFCSKAFKIKDYLARHIKAAHKDIERFLCSTCGTAFEQNVLLKRHMIQYHLEEKDGLFCCGICRETFVFKDTLRKHIRLHSKERWYKCSKCPKAFNAKGLLMQHIKDFHSDSENHLQIQSSKDETNTLSSILNASKVPALHHSEIPYVIKIKTEEDIS